MEHIDVAPRMWDKTIAAAYTPEHHKPQQQAVDSVEEVIDNAEPHITSPVVAGVSFFTKLKTYLLPVIFVIAIIIVVYVVWKYYTKYRNQKKPSIPSVAQIEEIKEDNPINALIDEDTSKYEYDSDEEETKEADEEDGHLSTIDECSESDETIEESNCDEDENEECDDESVGSGGMFALDDCEDEPQWGETVMDPPNLDEISSLLMHLTPKTTDNGEEDVVDSVRFEELDMPTYVDDELEEKEEEPAIETKKATKKTKRNSRVTL